MRTLKVVLLLLASTSLAMADEPVTPVAPVAPVVTSVAPVVTPGAPEPKPGDLIPDAQAPLAGYSEGNFYLRDRNSWFVLFPKGRVQVDWYNFLNQPNPPAGTITNDTKDPRNAIRDTVFIRRARIGISGTIAHHFDFKMEGEFATVPSAGQYATITDASVIVNYTDYIKLEVGQFFTPFTLENQTSDNYVDFMERAATVRYVVPAIRDTGAQIFGTLPRKSARYFIGVFNGDGQDFKNLDNHPAVIGRVLIAPLAIWSRHPAWTEDLWFGGSFWYQKTTNLGGAASPSTSAATQGDIASISTQSGFSTFSSNYGNGSDANMNAIRSHLAPDGTTLKYAFELNVPITRRYGLRGEYVHQAIDLREYNDVSVTGNVSRSRGATGKLEGYAWYVEAYAWLGHDLHIDKPGYYQTPHWKGAIVPTPAKWAVQLAAKYEHVDTSITGLATGTAKADPAAGHYALDVFELGASLYVSRHARVSANYLLNYVGAGSTEALNETKNLFYHRYDHELVFRLAIQL